MAPHYRLTPLAMPRSEAVERMLYSDGVLSVCALNSERDRNGCRGARAAG